MERELQVGAPVEGPVDLIQADGEAEVRKRQGLLNHGPGVSGVAQGPLQT